MANEQKENKQPETPATDAPATAATPEATEKRKREGVDHWKKLAETETPEDKTARVDLMQELFGARTNIKKRLDYLKTSFDEVRKVQELVDAKVLELTGG